jgi:hypothetical protein
VVPTVLVDGVGAVVDPTPPVADVYHNKLLPVAVRGEAAAPTQYVTGVITVGGGVETILMVRENVAVQPSASVTWRVITKFPNVVYV